MSVSRCVLPFFVYISSHRCMGSSRIVLHQGVRLKPLIQNTLNFYFYLFIFSWWDILLSPCSHELIKNWLDLNKWVHMTVKRNSKKGPKWAMHIHATIPDLKHMYSRSAVKPCSKNIKETSYLFWACIKKEQLSNVNVSCSFSFINPNSCLSHGCGARSNYTGRGMWVTSHASLQEEWQCCLNVLLSP